MGNEESQANTSRGVLILSALSAIAIKHDGLRPVSIAPAGAKGVGGLAECDVAEYNHGDPQAEALHKAHPDKPVIGTETVSAMGARAEDSCTKRRSAGGALNSQDILSVLMSAVNAAG